MLISGTQARNSESISLQRSALKGLTSAGQVHDGQQLVPRRVGFPHPLGAYSGINQRKREGGGGGVEVCATASRLERVSKTLCHGRPGSVECGTQACSSV